MDNLAFEFFNILIPAAKANKTLQDIRALNLSANIEQKIHDNILRAELYIANIAQLEKPLNINFFHEISNQLFQGIYTWAGFALSQEKSVLINEVIDNITNKWNMAILDDEKKYELIAHAYYSILKIKPFDDGNEKAARLFANYLALKFGFPLFEIVSLDDCELESADKGDLKPIAERIKKSIYNVKNGLDSLKLGPAALVSD